MAPSRGPQGTTGHAGAIFTEEVFVKCSKCGYTSFDYLKECKKCGEILDDSRESLNLKMSEPTLFSNLKDEPSEDIVDIEKSTPEVSGAAFAEPDFQPSPPLESNLNDTPTLSTSSDFTAFASQEDEKMTENSISKLGTLGSMETIKPRSDEKNTFNNLPKIELESQPDEINKLELTPSFDHKNDSPLIDNTQNIEFDLLGDDAKEKTDLDDLLQEDIPFEFSNNDLESDINLKLSDDNPDKNLIELELDMEDEESLDQILADLQSEK